MKKMLCLFSALTMALMSSCSSDDSSEDTNAVLLPKKITETEVVEGKSGSYTYTLTYDGNKLKELAGSDASRSVYTYTGDQITKVEMYHSSVLQSTDVYTYDGAKLVTKVSTWETNKDYQEKLTFVYNANGTINVNQSQIDNKLETKFDTTTLYTITNGNIVSSELIDGQLMEKITSTYDNKKSPFINITGLKALLDLDSDFDFYSANNTVKSVTVTYGDDGKVTKTATVETTNKYNNSNYITEFFSGDSKNSFKIEIGY